MAVRIAGINIPNDKRVEIALTYIYGIGKVKSNRILAEAKVNRDTRVNDLKEEEANLLREIIEKKNLVEGDLRRDIQSNLKRLQQIQAHRGIRHRKGLPVRGQRTKTNARTRKGKRRTVGGQK